MRTLVLLLIFSPRCTSAVTVERAVRIVILLSQSTTRIYDVTIPTAQGWREVYAAGALTKFYTDTFFDEVVKVNSTLVPIDNTTSKFLK